MKRAFFCISESHCFSQNLFICIFSHKAMVIYIVILLSVLNSL